MKEITMLIGIQSTRETPFPSKITCDVAILMRKSYVQIPIFNYLTHLELNWIYIFCVKSILRE